MTPDDDPFRDETPAPVQIPELLPGQVLTRTTLHPGELRPRGFLITCAYCGATRDWLVVEVYDKVYIRCRCTHEWLEPDIDLDTFNGLFGQVHQVWDCFNDAVVGFGYDGTFSGAYLN